MEDHGLGEDKGVLVDKAQEEYVRELGLGSATYELSHLYSEWSARATVVLASRRDRHLSEISKKMGYGQRAVFQLSETKAPDEQEMYMHQ
eukprot:848517-Karenia_brevis.AAC.1